MAQQISKPPEQDELQPQPHISQPLPDQHRRYSRAGIFIWLVLIGLLILSSTGLILISLAQALTRPVAPAAATTPTLVHTRAVSPTATTGENATATATPPIFMPGNAGILPLQLPGGHYVIYEQQKELYWIPGTGGLPQVISSPGYIYNQAIRPIVTPSGQLLYSGAGIWLTDIFGGTAKQIATLAPNQVITSMALSSDGSTIAWSTEPASGVGVIDIYAGPLTAPVKVFEQSSQNCPCFRIFAFINGSARQADTTLLLTDDQQSHEAIQFGLWTLDIANPLSATPQLLLNGNSQQGPLLLAPNSNVLLYSSYEGEVPMPTDGSIPDDVAVLRYANSLDVTTLDGRPLTVDTSQVLLPEQHELNNIANYHWVTTPMFTLDGHTLIYVEFSNQSQAPYDRSSAIYKAQISGLGKKLRVSKPQLIATSTTQLLELGGWFNNHILTFYADDTLYALDIQSGAVATIAQTGAYARVIAVVGLAGV